MSKYSETETVSQFKTVTFSPDTLNSTEHTEPVTSITYSSNQSIGEEK